MARRGQCRCGLVLTFHRTSHGYKIRCPSCGAVVRLRVGEKRRKRPRPDVNVELVPLSELSAETRAAPQRSRLLWVVALVAAVVALMLLGVVAGAVWWFWQ